MGRSSSTIVGTVQSNSGGMSGTAGSMAIAGAGWRGTDPIPGASQAWPSCSGQPYRRVTSHDALEHAELFGGWDHVYRQLTPGRFVGDFQEARIEGVHVQRERLNRSAEQAGAVPRNMVTFVAFAPSFDQCYIDGVRLSSDLVFVGGVGELHAMSKGGTDAILISMPMPLVAASFDPSVGELLNTPDARRRILQPRRGSLDRLRHSTSEMLHYLEGNPGAIGNATIQASLYDELVAHLIDIMPRGSDLPDAYPKSTTRGYIVEWARRFIQDHIDENITIARLCAEGRISRRTLQYSFEDVLDISPAKYLLAVRLNGLRRDLYQARGDILLQDAAARWGFWHMGRFAGQYRQFFGELPSITLKNAAAKRKPPSSE